MFKVNKKDSKFLLSFQNPFLAIFGTKNLMELHTPTYDKFNGTTYSLPNIIMNPL